MCPESIMKLLIDGAHFYLRMLLNAGIRQDGHKARPPFKFQSLVGKDLFHVVPSLDTKTFMDDVKGFLSIDISR